MSFCDRIKITQIDHQQLFLSLGLINICDLRLVSWERVTINVHELNKLTDQSTKINYEICVFSLKMYTGLKPLRTKNG